MKRLDILPNFKALVDHGWIGFIGGRGGLRLRRIAFANRNQPAELIGFEPQRHRAANSGNGNHVVQFFHNPRYLQRLHHVAGAQVDDLDRADGLGAFLG